MDANTATEASRQSRPRPYSRAELTALSAALDARWPRLAPEEARKRIARWRDGKSPYSRVRAHAIRLQLDAIITLALRCGLRRHEIRALDVEWLHYDNAYVVVWDQGVAWSERWREIPYTETTRSAVRAWLDFRGVIRPPHEHAWLNLWRAETVTQQMQRDAFDKLLRTYVGEGWTLKRLRDTCAVTWVRAGLPLEHLRQILGLATLDAVLPYAALVGGSVERRMIRLDSRFTEGVRPLEPAI